MDEDGVDLRKVAAALKTLDSRVQELEDQKTAYTAKLAQARDFFRSLSIVLENQGQDVDDIYTRAQKMASTQDLDTTERAMDLIRSRSEALMGEPTELVTPLFGETKTASESRKKLDRFLMRTGS